MKLHSRRIAAVVLAAVLSLSLAPLSLAAPRDDRPTDFRGKFIRVVKKLQHLFGASALDHQTYPPRP